MAGLTSEGFTPLTNEEIVTRISSRLEAFSPGIDLSAEAPDGHLVEIFSFELSQVWSELHTVYNSYNPNMANGAALRNLGLITGLAYGAATRSQVSVELTGTAGTLVPRNSVVSNADGDEFITSFDAIIPSTVKAVAVVSGPLAVDIGSVNTVVSPVNGWTGVNNTLVGRVGKAAQSETEYRNLRNKTVLRNYVSVTGIVKARLLETLDIEQVVVLNNDSLVDTLPDGTPPNTIHVTVGEVPEYVTDLDIAQVILITKGLGCPTYGSTTVAVLDEQGVTHNVSFSKATPKNVFMNIEILFLQDEYAGAEENIRDDLVTYINGLATDEDVVWSRLFGIITPYAKAQVNVLDISSDGITYAPANIPVGANEYPATLNGNINITVVN